MSVALMGNALWLADTQDVFYTVAGGTRPAPYTVNANIVGLCRSQTMVVVFALRNPRRRAQRQATEMSGADLAVFVAPAPTRALLVAARQVPPRPGL